jgi:hypothetical protein
MVPSGDPTADFNPGAVVALEDRVEVAGNQRKVFYIRIA